MQVLALADDMTGALEVGAKFSGAGIRTVVSAQPIPAGSAPVLVLDTETRHVSAEIAAQRIADFAKASGTERPVLVYKKTDSTLRGNIQAELAALSRIYPDWSIGYAPAYPALGRTVRAGVLYVHGRAVAETEFARDELNPIRGSSISALLGPHLNCRIFDGEADEHLAEAARVILSDSKMRIVAGPAGLAEIIARLIDVPRQEVNPYPCVRTCLVLNGSRHEGAFAQVRHCPMPGWRVLDTVHKPGVSAEQAAALSSRNLIGRTALESPDGVLVIGGDTAFAFIRELGFPPLAPIGEIVPGIPVTRIAVGDLKQVLPSRNRDLILITKAGGFGDHTVLTRVHAQLSGAREIHAE